MFKFALSEKVLLGSSVATAKIQRFSGLMIMNFRLSSEIAMSQNNSKAKYSFNHDIWCNAWQEKKTRLNQTTTMAWVTISTNVHFVEITLFKTETSLVIMSYRIFFCFIAALVTLDSLKGSSTRKKCSSEVDSGNVIIKGGYNVLNLCSKSIQKTLKSLDQRLIALEKPKGTNACLKLLSVASS